MAHPDDGDQVGLTGHGIHLGDSFDVGQFCGQVGDAEIGAIVNTLPPATMDAFRDHGKVRASLEENVDQAKQMMAMLDRSGISIDAVTARLVEEGVQLFTDAFDKLLGAVSRKRAAHLGEHLSLPPRFEPLRERLEATLTPLPDPRAGEHPSVPAA